MARRVIFLILLGIFLTTIAAVATDLKKEQVVETRSSD